MKSPFAESCTLLFIFCNFSTKTFDCSRNYILRSSELLFPPFRSLSGDKFELSEFISAGFLKLQLFCPVDIHMKNLLAGMCTFLFIFWTFSRKNLRIQQKKNRPEHQNCFFRVQKNFVKKKHFPLNNLQFFDQFLTLSQKNFVFQSNHFSRVVKTAMFIVHETLRGNIVPPKKLQFCSFFSAFWTKKV